MENKRFLGRRGAVAERIAEMRDRMTFVIVTHSDAFAAQLCSKAIVLHR